MADQSESNLQDDELYLGDVIEFFLNAKRAGGRSEQTVNEYRKKLDLFGRWAASTFGDTDADGEPAVDLPLDEIDTEALERYLLHLKDSGLNDTSRKNHLAVLRSFFDTLRKRKNLYNPTESLGDVRFHSPAPDRSYLTKREAGMLLAAVEQAGGEATAAGKPEKARLAVRDHADLIFISSRWPGKGHDPLVWNRLKDLAYQSGKTAYRIKYGLLHDYLVAQLKSPAVEMVFA